jgi:hypothetical protein
MAAVFASFSVIFIGMLFSSLLIIVAFPVPGWGLFGSLVEWVWIVACLNHVGRVGFVF